MDRHILQVRSRCLPNAYREEAIRRYAQEGLGHSGISSFSVKLVDCFCLASHEKKRDGREHGVGVLSSSSFKVKAWLCSTCLELLGVGFTGLYTSTLLTPHCLWVPSACRVVCFEMIPTNVLPSCRLSFIVLPDLAPHARIVYSCALSAALWWLTQ
jgi:hypothetical protein